MAIDDKKIEEILMNMGIGRNAVARDYLKEPVRFLFDKEIISLRFNEDKRCWNINDDADREMWFSQFNGIYISFDEHFNSIQKYGSCDLILLDGTSYHINELSLNSFIDLLQDREFEVSTNKSFNYYIYNKEHYEINSVAFKQIVDEINAGPYEALSNKIIKKGKCYILTEIVRSSC